MIVHAVPQIEDRSEAIVGSGASPLDAMRLAIRRLEAAGSTYIAIPCNTAHHWYSALREWSRVQIFHIAEVTCVALSKQPLNNGAKIALLATAGTLASGFYQDRLRAYGFRYLAATPEGSRDLAELGIRLVKAGEIKRGACLFEQCIAALRRRGAEAIVLGCTEIPIALDLIASKTRGHVVDSTQALAEACVCWWRSYAATATGLTQGTA
jgi:aspartate racemase